MRCCLSSFIVSDSPVLTRAVGSYRMVSPALTNLLARSLSSVSVLGQPPASLSVLLRMAMLHPLNPIIEPKNMCMFTSERRKAVSNEMSLLRKLDVFFVSYVGITAAVVVSENQGMSLRSTSRFAIVSESRKKRISPVAWLHAVLSERGFPRRVVVSM